MNQEKSENKSKKQDDNKRTSIRWTLVLYDLIIFVVSALIIFASPQGSSALSTKNIITQMILSGLSVFVVRFFSSIYKQIWRYGGIQSYIRMILSDGISFIIYLLLEIFLPIEHVSFAKMLAVVSINLILSLSMRMVYCYAYKCCNRDTFFGKIFNFLLKIFVGSNIHLEDNLQIKKIKIAIVGAGRVGMSLAEELINNNNASYIPVCFIDTNKQKTGRQAYGLPVLSEEETTFKHLKELEIQEVIFALPQISVERKKFLYDKYHNAGYKIKVYDFPTMQKVGTGKRHLREFDIEELLFRKSVDVMNKKVAEYYKNKVVLITGGGGSIGSELCRQIAKMQPKTLIILDVYENGAYDVQQELRIAYGTELDFHVEILSVCNRPALEKIFIKYKPQVVLNAAAHKHVPLMEHNCCEAVQNNVFGTLNTVELSEKYGVERFMMVSTDKAVNPTNVMGATKRMCEKIVMAHAKSDSKTTFSATRFGNVLGSAGSVIPLFKRQIANGGPITITDKRIIRYFMTIPEASQLVLQSASMAKNGELFVLDMGKPVKILDLAENMIRLSGFQPYVDIDIIETGLRPGEKLYEELLVKSENLDKTDNSMIFIEHPTCLTLNEIEKELQLLNDAIHTYDNKTVKMALKKAVPTFKSPDEVNAEALKADEMKQVDIDNKLVKM